MIRDMTLVENERVKSVDKAYDDVHLETPAFDSPDELSTAERMVAYLQQRETYEGERAYELLKQLVHALGQGQYGIELLHAREFINVSEFLKKKGLT